MSALCRGVDTHQGPSCVRSAPQFAELAYRLISVLCADRETSAPVLRYLRTHDFLYRHAQHLPFATAASGMYADIGRVRNVHYAIMLLSSATDLHKISGFSIIQIYIKLFGKLL